MAGLVSVAAMLHFMVKPVNTKYFDLSEQIEAKEFDAKDKKPNWNSRNIIILGFNSLFYLNLLCRKKYLEYDKYSIKIYVVSISL